MSSIFYENGLILFEAEAEAEAEIITSRALSACPAVRSRPCLPSRARACPYQKPCSIREGVVTLTRLSGSPSPTVGCGDGSGVSRFPWSYHPVRYPPQLSVRRGVREGNRVECRSGSVPTLYRLRAGPVAERAWVQDRSGLNGYGPGGWAWGWGGVSLATAALVQS